MRRRPWHYESDIASPLPFAAAQIDLLDDRDTSARTVVRQEDVWQLCEGPEGVEGEAYGKSEVWN
jgi:hypothetical protein